MNTSLPETFEEFGEARRNGFLKVKAVKDAGGRVAGTFCTFTPLEILDAAGFLPVSLCGMSAETIPAAERDLPKNLCPLIKSSYGFAVTDKCPYTYFSDLIVGETTCDGKKKMYEMLAERKKVYVLHLPQGQSREALDAWTKELRRFIAWLEENFSLRITDEALRRAVRERNEVRRVRRELLELQKAEPPMAWGYQLYKTLDGAGFLFSAKDVCEKVTALTRELRGAYARGERPVGAAAKRILVTGCPIGGVLEKTVKPIEENGGAVVCFENCTGLKAVMGGIDPEAEDIVAAIAERYLDIGCAVMTPDVRREELLRQLVKEYKIDGVVEVCLQACTPYTVEAFSVKKLMKELDMPYLGLETDYSESDLGQLTTRIEAFLELL